MRPLFYTDILLKTPPYPIAAAGVLRILHAGFTLAPGRYALALPEYERGLGRKLRVFASSRDELDELVDYLKDSTKLHQFGELTYPATVPDNYPGPWAQFKRFRIPSRKAERKQDGTLRLRRMAEADAQALPYFPISSHSNGHAFRLYVTKLAATDNGTDCQPDAYGLSVSSRAFSVPDLP
ncbi:CRISPR-associated endoribonuclease Cas6/Csy4 subtype I-F [Chitinivorax tropicus]|uniref:CRISPR-associated endoribonuclease Cas6/Csy4 subtype I-F n=1 Tax=Chitinivorax tropicus TaxID=714531 RepID=A0A840MLU0_9PROT|nr:type I-F CRISPR-associated endoribonuclease Cas6/Csy4 [Chitinivorax tropicus]MBB5018455.1 CRISPR-associated endoribonuclease Cas6/Csy4 subtype I-F [Chitinivorax tropicus]